MCASPRTKVEENMIIVDATASGSSGLRLYDPVCQVESTVDNFTPLNQAICLLICPLRKDRKLGIQLLYMLSDDDILYHMPFWIAALRHNNLREFSTEGIALDTDSWVGVAKNETSIPIDIDESVDDDEKDECLLLGECLVKRALASLPIYRKLYFALKAELSYDVTKSSETTVSNVTTDGSEPEDQNNPAIQKENVSSKKVNDGSKTNIKRIYDMLVTESGKENDVNNKKLVVVKSQESLMETVWDSWTKAGGKNKVGASKLLSSLQADTAFWEKLSDKWLPTSYNKLVTKAQKVNACVYPTSCLPVKIFFQVDDGKDGPVNLSVPGQEEVKSSKPTNEAEIPNDSAAVPAGIIFKSGDDLRQDQIVMSFCSLVQKIFENAGTNVKIRTYDIVARNRKEGCIEVVPNAKSINEIKFEFPLQFAPGYLAKAIEHDKEKVMNNLVESCAGACLYSYILALGDRHLDNLMMTDQGEIFHVDFGYILGKDPHEHKYTPPKIRLDGCVVHALQGVGSPYYERFEKLCLKGFVDLRRASTVLLRALYYIKYASIPSLINETKFEKRLHRMKKQLMWDKGQSESTAVLRFKDILEESRNHFLQPLVEVLHNCSTSFNR